MRRLQALREVREELKEVVDDADPVIGKLASAITDPSYTREEQLCLLAELIYRIIEKVGFSTAEKVGVLEAVKHYLLKTLD